MKTILMTLSIAVCMFCLSGCEEDFATVVNLGDGSKSDTGTSENTDVPDVTEPVATANTIRLGSYNLWISGNGTGDYEWTKRRSVLAQSIVDNGFDIFGFQEANSTIQDELPVLVASAGGNYEWWFIGRDAQDGSSGEAIGIAYDPDKFELSDQHFFWLSPTPDELSYGWGETSYHRIAACANVKDKVNKTKFFMMVTHGPLNDEARANAAPLLIEREQMYNTEGMPSILVGDMNGDPTDPAIATLCTHWNDAYKTAPVVSGPMSTFQSHSTSTDMSQESRRIDYVFLRQTSADDMELLSYRNDTSVYDGIYPSDHCPISVQLNINYVADELEGSGTESDPYLLDSANDWNKIAGEINSGSENHTSSTFYRLEADIDFADKSFTAISSLKGTFDGNGHTLSNIVAAAEDESFGIFCKNSGLIKDLAIEANLSSAFKSVGGIVGTNDGTIDGCTFYGTLTGTGSASAMGGICGSNNLAIVNCGNLGGSISAGTATKSECLGGIVGQNAGTSAYIVNCYSWIDSIASSDNNLGGVLGICSTDSFVINCYSTIEVISGGGSYAAVVGYSKVGNLQNIYGNELCYNSTGIGAGTVGNDKKAGAVYTTTTGLLLSLENMLSGSVKVPSSGEECESFAAALNAGAAIFNDTTTSTLAKKPDVTLREWIYNGSYPVLK